MLISLNWLRELVTVELPPEQLAEVLTLAGFEVEEIIDRRAFAEGVVVGKVLDCQRHPNADKLSVCTVDLGQASPSTIVCGAPNVKAGIFVPVAPPKTYLPAIDLKLKPTKLRGVKSEGMICSLAELGLAKESEGIHIFPDEGMTVGSDVRPYLGLDDVILDLTSTANRADALSMVGVAREVAALTQGEVKLPQASTPKVAGKGGLTVRVTEKQACPVYIGTVIEGVKIGPSPDWLKFRLQGAGIRPINNVVDVTNYVLLEWGQPLHAFDRDRLQTLTNNPELAVGVRFAQGEESLPTLDGQTRTLQPQNLLITVNDRPVALAGVMGGEESEVHDQTTNLLLEAALFDPVAIRRSSRCQGLRTESSARYERGVNPVELDLACGRAIALITKLAGGQVVSQQADDSRPPVQDWTRTLELRLSRLQGVLGQVKKGEVLGEIEASEVEGILSALGCKLKAVSGSETVWQVTIPPYRYRDLEREIDLIEEVARLYGYDRFCDTLPRKTEPGILPPKRKAYNEIRSALRGIGLTEVVHYSLVKPEMAQVVIANPLLSEYSALRYELVNGLLDAFEYNQSQGNGALNAFEIGRIFHKLEDGKLGEADEIAGILGGSYFTSGRWTTSGKGSPMTWYEAKGLLESAFSRLGVTVNYQPCSTEALFHPGRTASLWLGEQELGIFGQLHPQVQRDRNFPEAVYVFQLQAEVLLSQMKHDEPTKFKVYSPYPAVERDLAFFAPVDLAVGTLAQTMEEAGKALLEQVELFDEYQGKGVPEGQRSLAFSLAYRAGDRTLTDEEVEPVHQKVRDALVEQFTVTLRS
ncbi:phenylalanine--tRNA ligase subunit beta [Spirulina subsalsa FACHB-351]|uniref:Phenylalanine--tRNA ligase beta subunit n=1 Tax=Spirulina subsalsa FACHB-351 TaxID=234711 RepID=A0ABT3L0E0_9CYAN|nr:phenylalanine--tRNA ligase subunit beta [Spirulina subsalsa FACHB-351]